VNNPKKTSLIVLAFSAVLCAGAWAVRSVFPPLRAVTTPELAELRAKQAQLSAYSDGAVRTADARLAALRSVLWTDASFAAWRKTNVPSGWSVQDLGTADLQHLHGRRYAFQRPEATDREWPEITGLLGSLERAPAVSVTSAALAVQPGYAASRHFSQCLLIAVFYFTGDDGPPL
jgi:hypothetical protein